MSKKKVIVGLSGGVDSAVAVIKLLEAGYEVEGMFMRNWDSSLNNDILGNPHVNDPVCPQEEDYMDALRVAEQLGIKLHRVDFVQEYWERVFSYFLKEYENCRTPNPDVLCNSEIKFKEFLKKALEMDADYIAMGHYARSVHYPEVKLLRGVDENKDQSYFLCQLTKDQIAKALFPIGHLHKQEVREIAKKYNLCVANKKDSTGVCFIGERNFTSFLQNYLPAKPGNIEDMNGNVLGKHIGLMYYTIGQRKGIGIGGKGEPYFVIGKDLKRNVLLVGQGTENEYLYSNNAIITNVNWLDEKTNRNCTVKFRYRSKDIECRIEWINDNTLKVIYLNKAKAVTPGQAAVFYDGEVVLGGGTIDQVFMDDVKRMY